MKKFALLLLCTFSCIVYPHALDELKNYIMKSDIEGVKRTLTANPLTEKAKIGLIDLANDIILIRLRTVEIYSYKNVGQSDLNVLGESLSKETIKAVNNEYIKACNWEKRRDILLCCFCISFLMAGGIGHALEEVHDALACIIGVGCLGGFLGGGIFAFKKGVQAADMMKKAITAQATKIRNNLQKNYTDAILIKQLLINASVLITTLHSID